MKTSTSFVVIMFFLCFCFTSFGQKNKKLDSLLKLTSIQKDTSLVNSYNELFMTQFRRYPEEAKLYLDTANQIAQAFDNKKLMAKLTLSQAIYLDRTSDLRKAEIVYHDALTQFKDLKDRKNISFIYNSLGVVQSNLGKYEESLKSYLKSLKIREVDNPNSVALLANYANIGILHKDMGNYELAIEYYNKAEIIGVNNDFELELAMLRYSKSQIYRERKQYKEALESSFKAMVYLEKVKNYRLLGILYQGRGLIYENMGSLSRAKEFFNKALAICEDRGEKFGCSSAHRSIGYVNLREKNYHRALGKFFQSLESAEQTGSEKGILKNYEFLAKTYAAMGDYKNAYMYDTLHFKKYDTILKAENIEKINELEIQYQTEKKEQQIAQQETDISLLEEKEKVSNLQKMVLGGGLGLSALALGIGFYGFRQKIKRTRIEKEKVDAELAFKKKELTTHALHLAKKNEVLEAVKQKAKELKSTESGARGYQQLIQTINFDQQDDKNWENFTQYFEQVHKDFSKTVKEKYPEVTKNELRLMALLKMNLSSKEIATILNISSDGIKKARQRLRKKMQLSPESSLEATVLIM